MESSQFSKRGAAARGLDGASEDAPEIDEAHRDCWVCRGTGTLVSGADGEPHDVVCPWCEGTTRTIAGHDAQEHPSETPREKTPEEVEAAKERSKAMLAKRGGRKASGEQKSGAAAGSAAKKPAARKKTAGGRSKAKTGAAKKKQDPPPNTPIPRPLTRRTIKSDQG